jgi:L-ascorbate metabolism protein UlaG (beta-lactamase superfamily)
VEKLKGRTEKVPAMLKIIKTLIIICVSLLNLRSQTQNDSVKFYYLGHSSFLILFDNEFSVLADYGKPNAYFEYGWNSPIYDIGDFQPTFVTYSHLHDDHYDSTRVPVHARYVLKNADTLKRNNLTVYPILTSEDNISIFNNHSFFLNYNGIKILHLGDCQANIINIDSIDNENYIKNNIPLDCDVILTPIEGTSKFIPQLEKFIKLIHPKVVIPMHYWSNEYKFDFLNYLEKKNFVDRSKYRIFRNINSIYTYRKSENDDSVSIIDVYPSKLNR